MSIVLEPQAQERLNTNTMIWLTTVRPDGRPHSIPVWFLWEENAVLILSKRDNQKIRNIRHNPVVVLAIDDTRDGHDVVVLEGNATLLDHEEELAVLQRYAEKYRAGLQNLGVTAEQFGRLYSQPIRITPTRVLMG